MKKTLALAPILLPLFATTALAGGVNFNWGSECWSVAPVSHQTFACASNRVSLSWMMTASFALDTEMPDFVGVEVLIMGMSDAQTLPDWWQMGTTGGCRAGMAQFEADYSSVSGSTCRDWTSGRQCQVFDYRWDGTMAEITAGAALDTLSPFDLQPGVEYYAGGITILNGRTIGTDACTGCGNPFTWALFSVTALGRDGRRDVLDSPLSNGNQCLSWNNSYLPCGYGVPRSLTVSRATVPCSVTPVRARTWGVIKNLYR
jgi:hypothetical protein